MLVRPHLEQPFIFTDLGISVDTITSIDSMNSNQHTSTDGCFKELFEALEDPVVKFKLVEGEPVIVEANDSFGDIFGYESKSVIGEPLNDLIVPPSKQTEAKQFDQRTKTGESNAAVVERMTTDGKRKFLYRGVPYENQHGFAIYSDVTDELQRERHLDVLHRVLRHNLRNELTVVIGMAERIIETTDEPETRNLATKTRKAAGKLSQLSDEANTLKRVLGETVSMQAVDLQPMVSNVVDECETRFDDPLITAQVPNDIAVRADNELQLVLRSLLDNAIRHNNKSDPQAHIEAIQHDERTVEIMIVDNGPGIPKTEQQIITGDKEITPLNHGSGLGLWLVKWIIDSYGGWLDIETPSSGGTVVRLNLNTPE